jgi:hypothetical protein
MEQVEETPGDFAGAHRWAKVADGDAIKRGQGADMVGPFLFRDLAKAARARNCSLPFSCNGAFSLALPCLRAKRAHLRRTVSPTQLTCCANRKAMARAAGALAESICARPAPLVALATHSSASSIWSISAVSAGAVKEKSPPRSVPRAARHQQHVAVCVIYMQHAHL